MQLEARKKRMQTSSYQISRPSLKAFLWHSGCPFPVALSKRRKSNAKSTPRKPEYLGKHDTRRLNSLSDHARGMFRRLVYIVPGSSKIGSATLQSDTYANSWYLN